MSLPLRSMVFHLHALNMRLGVSQWLHTSQLLTRANVWLQAIAKQQLLLVAFPGRHCWAHLRCTKTSETGLFSMDNLARCSICSNRLRSGPRRPGTTCVWRTISCSGHFHKHLYCASKSNKTNARCVAGHVDLLRAAYMNDEQPVMSRRYLWDN